MKLYKSFKYRNLLSMLLCISPYITEWVQETKFCICVHMSMIMEPLRVFEGQSDKRREGGIDKGLPSAGLFLKCPQWPGLDQAVTTIQKLHPDLS